MLNLPEIEETLNELRKTNQGLQQQVEDLAYNLNSLRDQLQVPIPPKEVVNSIGRSSR